MNLLFRGIVEARVVYSIIATMAVHAALHYRSSESEGEQSISNSSHPTEVEPRLPSPSPSRRTCLLVHVQLAWTLLMLLLLRPHNVCVVFLLTLMEAGLKHVLLLPRIGLPTWAVTLLYSWVGQASFFYQVIGTDLYEKICYYCVLTCSYLTQCTDIPDWTQGKNM